MIKIEKLNKKIDTYDIQVEDNHNFYANNILVHNCEILQPTTPLESIDDPNGEIGICILSAINVLEADIEEYPIICKHVVSLLNNLIDYQTYPFPAAEKFCKNKRSLGVGITNFAAYLASKGLNHDSPESIYEMNILTENLQYELLNASADYAAQFGAAKDFHLTEYANGVLPVDKFENYPNEVVFELTKDWETLRQKIKDFGLANCTVTAQMPCESCVKWDTNIITSNGPMNFHEICEYGNIDWQKIEENNVIGWYKLDKSLKIDGKETDMVYYNGNVETYDILLEDGTTLKCTGNHKFLTKSGWKKVSELAEEDEILEN